MLSIATVDTSINCCHVQHSEGTQHIVKKRHALRQAGSTYTRGVTGHSCSAIGQSQSHDTSEVTITSVALFVAGDQFCSMCAASSDIAPRGKRGKDSQEGKVGGGGGRFGNIAPSGVWELGEGVGENALERGSESNRKLTVQQSRCQAWWPQTPHSQCNRSCLCRWH